MSTLFQIRVHERDAFSTSLSSTSNDIIDPLASNLNIDTS